MTDSAQHSCFGDLQANVLRSAGTERGVYAFFQITDAPEFRAFLADLEVSTQTPDGAGPPALCTSVAFTHEGLRQLGVSSDRLALLPDPFVQGMASRSALLGDSGRSAPEHWEGRFGTPAIHGVLFVGAPAGKDTLPELWRRATGTSGDCAFPDLPGTRSVGRCIGDRTGGQELLGFKDGLSQPCVQGFEDASTAAPGDLVPLRLGEFVLGYPDEWERLRAEAARAPSTRNLSGAAPRSIAGGALAGDLLRNGTYMVFRKIEVDVAGFHRDYPGERAARAIGRWRNGVPVSRAQDDERGPNDFTYPADPDPERDVPRDAHIRRAHPRSASHGTRTRLHRIIRRGLPYKDQDGKPRGLLFVCFNARIEDQFEFIQANYLASGTGAGLNSQDVDHLARVSTVRGGEYFFVPSRSVLRALAAREFEGRLGVNEHRDAIQRAEHEEQRRTRIESFFDPLDVTTITPALRDALLEHGAIQRKLPVGEGTVWLVGTYDEVVEILRDPALTVGPYRDRIEELSGKHNGMLTGADEPRVRASRTSLWDGMKVGNEQDLQKVEQLASAVLEPLPADPARPIAWVKEVARPIAVQYLIEYLGLLPPALASIPSPALVANHFAMRSGATPKAWEDALSAQLRTESDGRKQLIFWSRISFAHTFGNLRERPELREIAQLAVAEYEQHIDAMFSTPGLDSSTLVSRARELGSCSRTQARHMILELAVGSAEIQVRAMTNLMNVLVDRPEILEAVRSLPIPADPWELDRIVHEALRFDPVAIDLPRRYVGADRMGPRSYRAGDLVCALVGVASMDPRKFCAPDRFKPHRAGIQDMDYLTFGYGQHRCPGSQIALAVLRTVLLWAGQHENLRRAAGPRGSKSERELLSEELFIRIG